MGKSHLLAALVIVLSTSLFAPGDSARTALHTVAPQAGGNPSAHDHDADAPLLLRR